MAFALERSSHRREKVGPACGGLPGSISSLQLSSAMSAAPTSEPELPSPVGGEWVGAGESQECYAQRCPSTWEETSGVREKCSHPNSALVRKSRKPPPSPLFWACLHYFEWISVACKQNPS